MLAILFPLLLPGRAGWLQVGICGLYATMFFMTILAIRQGWLRGTQVHVVSFLFGLAMAIGSIFPILMGFQVSGNQDLALTISIMGFAVAIPRSGWFCAFVMLALGMRVAVAQQFPSAQGPLGAWGSVMAVCVVVAVIANQLVIHLVREGVALRARDQRMMKELQESLEKVRTLQGLIPICARCKQVRDDSGFWMQVESFVQARSDLSFTHGVCPDCAVQMREEYLAFRSAQEVPDPCRTSDR